MVVSSKSNDVWGEYTVMKMFHKNFERRRMWNGIQKVGVEVRGRGEGIRNRKREEGVVVFSSRNHASTCGPTRTVKCSFSDCTRGQFQRLLGVERVRDIVKFKLKVGAAGLESRQIQALQRGIYSSTKAIWRKLLTVSKK